MLQLIQGLDRSRFRPIVVLYEDKPIVQTLDATRHPRAHFQQAPLAEGAPRCRTFPSTQGEGAIPA
jgi:hypothetical protein